MDEAEVEDATGFAIVDLLDYWVTHPNSLSNEPDRNFWFAVKRAEWMGVQFLGQASAHLSNQDSLEALTEHGNEPVVEFDPDLALTEEEEREFARSVMERLGSRSSWLSGLLAGQSTREEARQAGVSQSLVCQRRKKATQEVQGIARQEGFLG